MKEPRRWLLLIVSLPTVQTAARMRLWRTIKAAGAVTLRDGIYLLPDTRPSAQVFSTQAEEVRSAGGDAWMITGQPTDAKESLEWQKLFDRGAEYAELIGDVGATEAAKWPPSQATRRMQALWRRYHQIAQADHFPGEARRQAQAALETLQSDVLRLTSPDEPKARRAGVKRLDAADYQGRVWATRARPWVDRLASAWLIRRCIDPQAKFRWLSDPTKSRRDWLGFDFDGATFSHTPSRVTYETLLASFGLHDDPGLVRVGSLVHFLDVGGIPVAQAPGIEAALSGLRETIRNDDALLDAACAVFDGLRRVMAVDGNS